MASPMETAPADPDYPAEVSCLLSCVFCSKAFAETTESLKGAKLLLCFHSVCKSCFTSWKDNELKTCPICKFENKKSDSCENKLLQELVEEPESDQNGMCKLHIDMPVTKYCINCKVAVCQTCIQAHEQLLAAKSHAIVELVSLGNEVDFNCSEHAGEKLKMYCRQCETVTCRDCQLGKHKQHSFELYEDIIKEEKKIMVAARAQIRDMQTLVQNAEKLNTEKKANILTQQAEIKKTLDESCEKVIQRIQNKFNSLKGKLDTCITQDLQKLESSMKEIEDSVRTYNHAADVMDLLLMKVSDDNYMFTYGHYKRFCQAFLFGKDMLLPKEGLVRKYRLENYDELIRDLDEYVLKWGNVISVLEEKDGQESCKTISQASSGQMEAGSPPSQQTVPSRPVRLRPTGDLQSPELRLERRISQDPVPPAASNVAGNTDAGASRIRWHTPEQPRAKHVPLASSHPITLESLLSDTTVVPAQAPPSKTPPITMFGNTTISPVRTETVASRQPTGRRPIGNPAYGTNVAARNQLMTQQPQPMMQLQQFVSHPQLRYNQQLQRQQQQPQQPMVVVHSQQKLVYAGPTAMIPPPPYSAVSTVIQTPPQTLAATTSRPSSSITYLQNSSQVSISSTGQYVLQQQQQQQQPQQQLQVLPQQQNQQQKQAQSDFQAMYDYILPDGTHNFD